MNTHETTQSITPTKPTTASAVLARIQSEHLTPTPRYAFAVREYTVWTVWGLSIVIGALALAVTVYDALSTEYALYEATHDNFWTFLVGALPYVWVMIFAAMAAAAVVGVRQTKWGYRYRTSYIIGSSLLCSVLGALFFHMMGFGYALDTLLGHQIGQYMSMEKTDLAMWQAPADGRLIGVLATTPDDVIQTLQFEDAAGNLWTISNTEINDHDMRLLQSGDRVRLLGTTTDDMTFHICGVFPWMYSRAMSWGEMQHERVVFEQTMAAHREMAGGGGMNMGPGQIPPDQICTHLRMMARMRP